jgi:hypothetical protein
MQKFTSVDQILLNFFGHCLNFKGKNAIFATRDRNEREKERDRRGSAYEQERREGRELVKSKGVYRHSGK